MSTMSIGYGGIVRVRYEEYIVGILFALISPYLRRLHLLEYQVTHVSLLWRYHPWRFEEYISMIRGNPKLCSTQLGSSEADIH